MGVNDPQDDEVEKNTCKRAHPWAKTRLLSHCASESDKWFGLWVDGRIKKYIDTYIDTYTFRRYISPPRGGAIFEPIDLKFCRLVISRGVINFAKFGIDRTYGFGVVRGQSLGVPI